MNINEKRFIRFRIYTVGCFFVLSLAVIMARAYQLQIYERGRLEVLARATYRKLKRLPPKRGSIYDRNGHEMAVSVEAWSVYARPHKIKSRWKTARQLSRIIHKKVRSISLLLKKDRRFVWIIRKIPAEWAMKIKKLDIDGIGVLSDTRRYYPNREVAAHVIGFVGTDNQGLEGLEKRYDSILRGPKHTLLEMKDAFGRPFYMDKPVVSGMDLKDIYLTIDRDIQYKVQEALREAVRRTKAKSGNCIVLDPVTGEVLAMADVPEFNPNIFNEFKVSQWRNRAVTDCYEPGSTIKAILLAAALEEGVVTPDTKFDCEHGRYNIAGHIIHDSHKHGILSVSEIIAESSNIGAIKIGRALGYDLFYRYLRKFGFGEKTGIDLLGERRGSVRLLKDSRPVDQATAFFGQGVSVTSIQLAMAFAAIANGGKLMRPYVVKEIRYHNGKLLHRTSPKVIRRVISPATAQKTAMVLEKVTGKTGTAPAAAIYGFNVAGKTGTSQKINPKTGKYSRRKYEAIFVGFVPVRHPKMVILVMIDEPKGIPYGGIVSAPVFKKVGLWTLNYMKVKPQKSDLSLTCENIPVKNRVLHKKNNFPNDRLPDFTGSSMRRVLNRARQMGLVVTLEGTGMAVKQYPKPGVLIKKVKVLKVYFRPPA